MNPYYALALILAATSSTAIVLVAWRRRTAPGASGLMLFLLADAIWAATYAVRWMTVEPATQLFWLDATYFGVAFHVTFLAIFTLQFTRRSHLLSLRNLTLLAIVPLITLLLLWTDSRHGLFFGGHHTTGTILNGGPWFWFFVVYSYTLILILIGLFSQAFFHAAGLYRQQTGAILVGACLPVVGNILSLAGFSPFPNLDLTPFIFTFSGLIYAYALFGLRLLDVMPVARHKLVDVMTDGVIVLDAYQRIVDINPAARQLIGISASLIGQSFASALGARLPVDLASAPKTPSLTELRLSQNPPRAIELQLLPLLDHRQALTGHLLILHDITGHKEAEENQKRNALELQRVNQQLEIAILNANNLAVQAFHSEASVRESEAHYRAVIDTASDAIISANSNGTILDWNPGAERIFGYSKTEACGQPLTILIPTPTQTDHLAGMERVQTGGPKHIIGKTVELLGRRKDGSEFPLELSLSEWQVAGKTSFAAVIRDITERKRLKEELQIQAATDELTGLFNRRHFHQTALLELDRARRLNQALAMVLIDIDRFKRINDTFGHAVGDQVLLSFTKICKKTIRDIDVFARFGGDEFALLLPGASPEKAFGVADRIRAAVMAQPFDLNGEPVYITISAGIAMRSGDEATCDRLLSQADQALYRAKESGRNLVVRFGEW